MNHEDAVHGAVVGWNILAGALLAAGATSLINAADGWQEVLYTQAQLARTRCPGVRLVPGWGDHAVVGFALAALVFVGLTGWATLRGHRWGKLTAFLAIALTCILWLDAYAVSQAPSTDCDALGLGGAASAAIVRAGWCFFAASILCGISWAWLACFVVGYRSSSTFEAVPPVPPPSVKSNRWGM